MTVPLAAQIAELEREQKMRKRVYPRFVAENKMTQSAADTRMQALEAAIKTLRDLQETERLF